MQLGWQLIRNEFTVYLIFRDRVVTVGKVRRTNAAQALVIILFEVVEINDISFKSAALHVKDLNEFVVFS